MKKIERCIVRNCGAEYESRWKDIPHFKVTKGDREKYPDYCPDCVEKAEAYDKAERKYIDTTMEAMRKAPEGSIFQFKTFQQFCRGDVCDCGAIQKAGGTWQRCRCDDIEDYNDDERFQSRRVPIC